MKLRQSISHPVIIVPEIPRGLSRHSNKTRQAGNDTLIAPIKITRGAMHDAAYGGCALALFSCAGPLFCQSQSFCIHHPTI